MKNDEPHAADAPAVSIENCRLCLERTEEHSLLFRLDRLRVSAKEQVAFVGPSGCGKSTMLNLVSGMIIPDKGNVKIQGVDLAVLSASRRDVFRGSSIGMVHQSFNLLDGFTALENVLVGMRYGRARVRNSREYALQLLRRVGLSRRAHASPRSMSAGERQRVAIARAVANHPSLLLADEPTGSLDAGNARAVMDLILEMASEYACTLMMVTHDPELAGRLPQLVDCRDFIVHEEVSA